MLPTRTVLPLALTVAAERSRSKIGARVLVSLIRAVSTPAAVSMTKWLTLIRLPLRRL